MLLVNILYFITGVVCMLAFGQILRAKALKAGNLETLMEQLVGKSFADSLLKQKAEPYYAAETSDSGTFTMETFSYTHKCKNCGSELDEEVTLETK